MVDHRTSKPLQKLPAAMEETQFMNKVIGRVVNDIDDAIFETTMREGMQYMENSNRAPHPVSTSIWPATIGTSGRSKVE